MSAGTIAACIVEDAAIAGISDPHITPGYRPDPSKIPAPPCAGNYKLLTTSPKISIISAANEAAGERGLSAARRPRGTACFFDPW
jgi:hypothetical protein